MIKKARRFIGDLIEKIFKRKELLKFKTSADLLEKEVGKLEKAEKEMSETICLLTSGQTMNLTQNERRMILWALDLQYFKDIIQLPQTKAHFRITYRELREQITRSLVKEVDLAEKEDDETKEAKIENP